MRLTVITGPGGEIIGTARSVAAGNPEAGTGGPVAGPGQSVAEIEVPDELADLPDPDELHRRLKEAAPSQ